MNQIEFAEALEVSVGYLSELETNKTRATLEFILKLVDSFQEKSKFARILILMSGYYEPTAPGSDRESSALSFIRRMDAHALEAAFESLEVIEMSERKRLTPDIRARYIREALYVYTNELLWATEDGTKIDVARSIAKRACEAITHSLDLPLSDQPSH